MRYGYDFFVCHEFANQVAAAGLVQKKKKKMN